MSDGEIEVLGRLIDDLRMDNRDLEEQLERAKEKIDLQEIALNDLCVSLNEERQRYYELESKFYVIESILHEPR